MIPASVQLVDDSYIKIIDQTKIPNELEFVYIESPYTAVFAIKNMQVRGAPAIGVFAAFALALSGDDYYDYFLSSRPTAVDLKNGLDYVKKSQNKLKAAKEFYKNVVEACKQIGKNGSKIIKNNSRILTHCNAGALATSEYGTALSPIFEAFKQEKNISVFCDETRPRLQGILTHWELKTRRIPSYLIADNASGLLMNKKEIDLVIVGADRICANGDFANKIGTYEKAVLAKENNIPFYVAAPFSTFDFNLKNGKEIEIEERPFSEFNYNYSFLKEKDIYNPAFDVTPSKYVTAFITEKGIIKPKDLRKLK